MESVATQTCEYQELKQNQSAVFGWQLAGTALDTAQNDDSCNTLPSSPIANVGLDIQSIKGKLYLIPLTVYDN